MAPSAADSVIDGLSQGTDQGLTGATRLCAHIAVAL